MDFVQFFYNAAQIFHWGLVLVHILRCQNPESYYSDPYYKKNLEITQLFQLMDLVFSVLGVTRNKVAPVFCQLLSRFALVFWIFGY